MTTKRFDALSATMVSATTLCATSFCGTTVKAGTISATKLSAADLSANHLSGTHGSSACELYLVISKRAGKTLSAHSSIGGTSSISADGYLSASIGGVNWYIPICSGVTWQA